LRRVDVDEPGDARLADYQGLRLRDDRRRDHFVAEGYAAVAELVRSPYRVRSVLVLDRKAARVMPLVEHLDVTVFVAPEPVLRSTIGFNLHRGIIASADRPPARTVGEVVATAHTLAVLERLNDHENLGVLFRSARALAVDGVVLDPETADPLYRRCVRVSMGHALHVPFARAGAWPDALDDLRAGGIRLIALTPAPDAPALDDLDRDLAADRVAFVLGAEGPGLSAAALSHSDTRARIPLAYGVDSLNVATAAAIAFHARMVARGRRS